MEEIKETHYDRWGKLYTGVGIGLSVGLLFSKIGETSVDVKPLINNNPVFTNTLVGKANLGKVVRVKEWDATFSSQNSLAKVLGVAPITVKEALEGTRETVNGLHLEQLGNM